MLTNIKIFCKQNEKDIFLAIIIAFVALFGFGFGRLSKIEETRAPVKIENLSASVSEIGFCVAPAAETWFQKFVASKNGDKYHFPWCAGAKRIKEANKIWFATQEEAKANGYSPASNCKGLSTR